MIHRLFDVRWVAGGLRRNYRWVAVGGVLAATADVVRVGSSAGVFAFGLGFGAVCLLWRAVHPGSYERRFAGPLRRVGWRWHLCHHWPAIAERCGLSDRVISEGPDARRRGEVSRFSPRLRKVRTRGHLLEVTIRARAGQTAEELEEAAPRLAATMAAVSFRTRPPAGAASTCSTVVELVMVDSLTTAVTAREPLEQGHVDALPIGRTQAGGEWRLQLRGRHTLIAGCSGAGKGSVMWGVCGGLAPAVHVGIAQLWGIDLKRGVELEMGAGLFSARAYKPSDALAILTTLLKVIEERGTRMAGTTRLHEPTSADPLHVLVIDELATLTAYSDLPIRRAAERLLSEILSQGRALGVVVIACVQDPRKEVVTTRGLFTQTIALRLRSSEETAMVLGDGMTRIAPAHRISPSFPGTAWIVEDTGAADRVRADFWPDDLIREVARSYASPVQLEVEGVEVRNGFTNDDARPPRPRSARKQDVT